MNNLNATPNAQMLIRISRELILQNVSLSHQNDPEKFIEVTRKILSEDATERDFILDFMQHRDYQATELSEDDHTFACQLLDRIVEEGPDAINDENLPRIFASADIFCFVNEAIRTYRNEPVEEVDDNDEPGSNVVSLYPGIISAETNVQNHDIEENNEDSYYWQGAADSSVEKSINVFNRTSCHAWSIADQLGKCSVALVSHQKDTYIHVIPLDTIQSKASDTELALRFGTGQRSDILLTRVNTETMIQRIGLRNRTSQGHWYSLPHSEQVPIKPDDQILLTSVSAGSAMKPPPLPLQQKSSDSDSMCRNAVKAVCDYQDWYIFLEYITQSKSPPNDDTQWNVSFYLQEFLTRPEHEEFKNNLIDWSFRTALISLSWIDQEIKDLLKKS